MNEKPPYSCEEVLQWLEDYLDQELSAEEMQRMLRHLNVCMECDARSRRAYEEMARLRAAIQQVSIPETLMPQISERLAQCDTS